SLPERPAHPAPPTNARHNPVSTGVVCDLLPQRTHMPRSARWTDVYWQPSGRAGMERYSAAMAMDRSLSHLSTAQLLAGARAEAVRDDPDAAVPYLVCRHLREKKEVFDTEARLLPADDPIDRELGARILRELGRQDETG